MLKVFGLSITLSVLGCILWISPQAAAAATKRLKSKPTYPKFLFADIVFEVYFFCEPSNHSYADFLLVTQNSHVFIGEHDTSGNTGAILMHRSI